MRKILTYVILIVVMGATFMLFRNNPDLWPVYEQDEVTTAAIDTVLHPTGLVRDDGLMLVIANCTGCHSAKLVTQNRASREGWKKMIGWMQETQGLWDLGPNEEVILDYLSENYAPLASGRRRNLSNIEWYELEQN